MHYADEELKRWWSGLGDARQLELLGTMAEKMDDPSFALSLAEQYQEDRPFTPRQLASIRKWDHD